MRGRRKGLRELASFESGLSGDLPSAAHGSDVILAACNDSYFDLFARSLVRSIERLGKEQPLHIHLLDPSDEVVRQAETLKRDLRFVKLTFTTDRCALAQKLSHKAIYFTAARFLLAPLILRQGIRRLLIIDIDAVMNASPWALFGADSTTASCGFIFRRGMRRPWYKVLASAVSFNGSRSSLQFSEALAQSLAAVLAHNPRYHVDQILPLYLCNLAPRHIAGFSAIDIPRKMMGYDYEPDTAFWTVKGKSDIGRFLAEKDRLAAAAPV